MTMPTPWTAFGEPVVAIDEDVFAVTYPERISEATAQRIKEAWRRAVGDKKRLIVLDSGATLTRITDHPRLPESTPIYDALAAEFGWLA